MNNVALSVAVSAAAVISLSPLQVQAAGLYVSTSSGEVGSVDEASGAYTSLVSGTPAFSDIALDPEGKLWGINYTHLYSIDLASKTTANVGSLGFSLNGLGFSDDGTLYGTGAKGFYSINTGTGAASLISSIFGFSSSGDIAYDSALDLFWATSSGDSLWSITKEGKATKMGNIGFRGVAGLAFGDDNALYGYTREGKQIALNLETGAGTFVKSLSNLSSSVWGSASDPSDGSSPPTPTLIDPPPTNPPTESNDGTSTKVPEPATIMGFLVIGAFLVGSKPRRQP
ncbi:MAG: SMP-30/gluconolactonase/LRE family protein [Oscillatoria sp. Prado101]|jgi:hypothetical protein|nr:SMP-30/gluconolactonase/LRE family protein [Oscillatoria sp. Prado101]